MLLPVQIKAATAAHTSTVAIGQVGTARTARHTSPQEYAASPAMRHRNITAPMARVSPQAAAAIKAKLGRAHSGPISGPTVLDGTTVINDRQIGDYVLLKTLGKGTFGKVKLAEHCVTKEMVGRSECGCLSR